MMKGLLHFSLQMVLIIVLCHSLRNVGASRRAEHSGFISSNIFRHLSINVSHCEPTKTIWNYLAIVTVELFKFQNDLLQQLQNNDSALILVVFESFTQTAASDFIRSISSFNVHLIYFEVLKVNLDLEKEFEEISEILIHNRDTINSVVLFLDNPTFIFQLFYNVSFTEALNLTTVRHVTEWIVVSRHFPFSLINESNILIDFISVIFNEDHNRISLAQKSRIENFTVKVKIRIDPVLIPMSESESHRRVHWCLRYVLTKNLVRKSGHLYLKSKKSVLSGLHIPIAMVSMKTQDLFVALRNNKLTNYESFALAFLECLATHLGFTYYIVLPSDNGYFGIVDNGNVTGMTGQFKRREAALTTMAMNPVNNRMDIMDFVPVQIMNDMVYFVYRLPQQTDFVDTTYIKIIRPDFLYVHIAPVLFILVLKAAVHYFWQTRQTTGSIHGNGRYRFIRKLHSFLVHLCGDSTETRSRHSERILTASWQVVWFIMWSACSAYLVTSFVASPKELIIKSFKDLDENRNFQLGMMTSLSSTVVSMRKSESIHIRSVWDRLEASRKLNPLTFSPEMSDHARRILEGGYAFIDGSGLLLDEYDYIIHNSTDIRYYPTTDLNFMYRSFIGIPFEVFYKEALLKLVRDLDENGTLERLKNRHFNLGSSKLSHKGQITEDNNSVSLRRVGLLLFSTFGGIFLSAVTLICERFFYRWMSTRSREH